VDGILQEKGMKIQVQVSLDLARPRWLPRWSRRLSRGLVIVALMLTALMPMSIAASHRFTDVPDSNPFHAAIDAIANAGITGGCGATTYCPDQAVTRGQMGAFMHRGLGRVAINQPDILGGMDHTAPRDVAQVLLTVGGTGATSTQYVKVDGSVNVFGPNEACPCYLVAYITDETDNYSSAFYHSIAAGGDHTFTASGVFEATPGPHTYTMTLEIWDWSSATVTPTVNLFGPVLTAATYPFGEVNTQVATAGGQRRPDPKPSR